MRSKPLDPLIECSSSLNLCQSTSSCRSQSLLGFDTVLDAVNHIISTCVRLGREERPSTGARKGDAS